MDKSKSKKVMAVGAAVLLVGAGAVGGALMFPRTVTVEKEIPVTVEVEKIVEVKVPVPGPVQTIEKIVEVDNGNLQLVLDEMQDRSGDMSIYADDIDSDETEMIVDRIIMTHEWDTMAISHVKSELFDELDKETVDGTELDEDEMRSLYIDDDDVTFEDVDFDDKDAEFLVPFKLRQDDEKFEGVARVIIREGVVDDLIVDSIDKI